MNSAELRALLTQIAATYASCYSLPIDQTPRSAVIFENIGDNFHPESFVAIQQTPEWCVRLEKRHPKVNGIREMQSSNSSDALLMSIFCHPRISRWKGISKVLGFSRANPQFGFSPLVAKEGTEGDATEIDMLLGNTLYEAKLTEEGFTEKEAIEVERYTDLDEHFHVEQLPRNGEQYQNYQVIRNLLAMIQHDMHHVLLCDARRPDLIRSYMNTVVCLKKMEHRKRCRVILWQELAKASGQTLRPYLKFRYGI